MNIVLFHIWRFIVMALCGPVPFTMWQLDYISVDMFFNWTVLVFIVAAYLNYKNLTKPIEVKDV